MQNILFIILIFIELYLFNCYVVLPINILPKNNYISKNATNTSNNPAEIMYKQFFTPLITYLYIGTPPKKIYLLIKPKKNFFIVNTQNILTNLIKVKYLYDLKDEYSILYNDKNSISYNSSNKWANSSLKFAEQICVSKDNVFFSDNLKHKTIETQSNNTGIEFNLTKNTLDNITGIVGLHLFDKKNTTSFLNVLKTHNIINDYHWYFDFDKWDSTSGNLIIGISPHEINKNKFKKKNLNIANNNNDTKTPMNYYEMKFNQIYFINKLNNSEKYSFIAPNVTNETIEFNFESNVIAGTDKCKIYFESILVDLKNQSKCNLSTFVGIADELINSATLDSYEFYFCKNDNNIEKELKKRISSLYFYSIEMNYTFEITKEQILKKIGDKIFINIVFNKNTNKAKKWILGKPFIFKYKLVYDSYNGTIGFYKKETHDKLYKLLIIIPLIIYLCIGPSIIGIKLLRRNNKNFKTIEERSNEEEEKNLRLNIIN